MEQEYLVDTNVIIDYLGQKLPDAGRLFMNEVIDATPKVSIISKIEVLGFNAPNEQYELLLNFMDDAILIHLTAEVVDKTIEIRKKQKIKLPDAIIAATAIVYNYTLISRNTSDFKNIVGLRLIDAHAV